MEDRSPPTGLVGYSSDAVAGKVTWKNVKIRSGQYDQLKALAKKDHRSVAAQLNLLLGQPTMLLFDPLDPSPEFLEALKQAGEVEEGGQTGAGVAQVEEQLARKDARVAGSIPVHGPQSDSRPTPPSSTSSRKATCPHRIPPGSYCRVCDG